MNRRIELFIELMKTSVELRMRHRLGEGSSREVYKLGELIIKLPKNFFKDNYDYEETAKDEVFVFGILQSLKEIEVWENSSRLEKTLLAKMHCHGEIDGFPYIVMEEISVAENLGISCGCDNDDILEIVKSERWKIVPAFERITGILQDRYNLKEGDLFGNSGNFGITKDKKVVICDYGFCGWTMDSY